ncbi:MAG: hypothetical protein WB499_17700 [Pseudolabrys sp.]
MTFGFPWRVKGIRPEARHTAREAARRAGLPLNDWLNAIILQQAAAQGIKTSSIALDRDEGSADDLSDLHHRLDDLTRRIDQVTRTGAAAYAPKRGREEFEFDELFARLEQRFDQFAANIVHPATQPAMQSAHPHSLDRPEIVAPRQTFNGEAVHAHTQQSAPAAVAAAHKPAPSPDLSGLEDQLRRITDQIETLRRPGVEEDIAALRTELGEISCTLNEAMPRRAIEIIEKQIHALSQRIAVGRQAGVDGNALAGIERGLAEVRDALRDLTPAENLVGYTDAIAALSHKIDLIVAQKDPATMQQLERSLATLREMAAHVASNETISGLSAQVRALADKIDHVAASGGSDAFNKLELRIDALSRAMTDRALNGDAVPLRVEALVQSLSEKIEQIQQSRTDQIALGHLEDCIAKLVERLSATDSRLNHLDAIERGLADLLVHIEEIRANKEAASLRADNTPAIDLLKQDMARTQNTLEAVHGTLGFVANRLAVIEKDIRIDRPAPAIRETDILELTHPADEAPIETVAAAPDAIAIATAPAHPPHDTALQTPTTAAAPQPPAPAPDLPPTLLTEFSNLGVRPASQPAIEPAPPADQPLEPGSGAPRFATHPGVRIAASEAALGVARPSAAAAGGKSDFIAAARRAAQAAGQDPKGHHAREPYKTKGGETASARPKVVTRVKAMFLAASIVAIIIGSIQFASNILDFGIFDTKETKLVNSPEPDTANSEIAAEPAQPETSTTLADSKPAPSIAPATKAADADITASLLAPPTLPSSAPAASPPAPGSAPIQPPLSLDATAKAPPLVLNAAPSGAPPVGSPPGPKGAPRPKSDVTGSIAQAPVDAGANRQPAPAADVPTTDGLPAAIGGARLRNAAVAGDPAAAYEVAMRFMEGRGVPANLEEAARWYERAASKGLVPAQFRYASMLEKGQGVKKDLAAAQKLYVAAASKGHAKAMHNLAVLYAEGVDGKPDYANAAQWFRRGAEHGVADSQYNLGVLTARGLGTDKNIAESYKWFALAAAQGDRDASRKRDDVAAYLNAQTLAAVQEAVKSFAVQPQPAEATVVPEPPGGWDRAAPPPRKPRSSGPLSLGDFNSGKL